MKSIPILVSKLCLVALLALFVQPAAANTCPTLWAGQDQDAGEVCITVDGEDLLVTFETNSDWTLDDLHLWVGIAPEVYDPAHEEDCNLFDGLRMTNSPHYECGNPAPGQMPYKASGVNGSSYQFRIPLADIGEVCDKDLVLVAHADVTEVGTGRSEGAWVAYDSNDYVLTGDDGERPKGNWALFALIEIHCGGELRCETAFAKGGTTFNDWPYDLTGSQRWGWILGPFDSYFEHAYFELWAAAGQNDTDKGDLAGYVSVHNDGGNVTVTYYTLYPWMITNKFGGSGRVHVFVGGAEGLEKTAPGSYGNTVAGPDAPTFQIQVGPVEAGADPFYVVAHAEVCEHVQN